MCTLTCAYGLTNETGKVDEGQHRTTVQRFGENALDRTVAVVAAEAPPRPMQKAPRGSDEAREPWGNQGAWFEVPPMSCLVTPPNTSCYLRSPNTSSVSTPCCWRWSRGGKARCPVWTNLDGVYDTKTERNDDIFWEVKDTENPTTQLERCWVGKTRMTNKEKNKHEWTIAPVGLRVLVRQNWYRW